MSQIQAFADTDLQPPAPLGYREAADIPATILLVEDEALVRDVTCEILQGNGYRVLKARDAREAKALFAESHVTLQLLLTDVVLPGQNGRDLAMQLRAVCPTLQTILISGYPLRFGSEDHGPAQEGMHYLPKPFSAELLLRKVHDALHAENEWTV